jgi:glycosyltransferase involved in cell wall biosynthesis
VTLTGDDIFRLTVPSKVQAYLAAGRPILAALDGEGARVVAEAGAGVCTPAQDAAALAAAVRRMAAMPRDQLESMGRSGRDYYNANFAPAALARRMLALLDEAVQAAHQGDLQR